VAYVEANWGRIESWHPAPVPFYEVGVLFDVAVYPLTLLTAMFGPARSVWAYGRVLAPDRTAVDGTSFRIQTPDFIVAMIELRSGPLVRLTATFYVGRQTKQRRGSLELHGDGGSLYLSDWHDFDGPLEFATYGQPYEVVELLREPYRGVDWGRAVVDMAGALAKGQPHRATGEQAAHVVEIVCAAATSMKSGLAVPVHSDFPPPAPMDWAH
jgi:predicted dehydrogenase